MANEQANYWIQSYFTDEVLEGVQKLNELAKEAGMSLAQMAIAWVLRQPGVSSAIIGASRPEQVIENVKATDVVLTLELLERIDRILAEIPANPIW